MLTKREIQGRVQKEVLKKAKRRVRKVRKRKNSPKMIQRRRRRSITPYTPISFNFTYKCHYRSQNVEKNKSKDKKKNEDEVVQDE